MKKNIHISLTNCKNASRILKESKTIIKNKIADKVFIVALWEAGLAEHEQINESIEIWRVPLKTRSLPKNFIFQILKYFEFFFKILIRFKKEHINFINCHDLTVLIIGLIYKLFFRSKIIYDVHELETERNGLKGIRKKLVKITEKLLIRYVDMTIVVSNMIANEYKKMYPIKRPLVILNCPNFCRIEKQNLFRERFSISSDARIFLYQGAFLYKRGIEIILEGFANLKNPNTNVVVFMGFGILEKKIQAYAKIYSNIFLHEVVSPDNLFKYTASADVGLSIIESSCLSYYYCLPNKLFEYIMAGLPVIISDLPEMKKIVEIHNLGLILKNNTPIDLIKTIEGLTIEQIEIFKTNSFKISHLYSWETQEEKLLNAYHDLFYEEQE